MYLDFRRCTSIVQSDRRREIKNDMACYLFE